MLDKGTGCCGARQFPRSWPGKFEAAERVIFRVMEDVFPRVLGHGIIQVQRGLFTSPFRDLFVIIGRGTAGLWEN